MERSEPELGNWSERRANLRLNRVLAIALDPQGEDRRVVAVDLSISGFQAASSFSISCGQIVSVRLHLSSLPPVSGTAKVIWCESLELGLFRLGFRFEEMSSLEDFERLCRFVDKESLTAESQIVESTLELASQVTLRSMTDIELDRFAVLARIAELLNGCYELQELLDRALKIMVEATGAERGIMLLDRGGSDYEVPAFHAVTNTTNRAFSRIVVDQVLATGEPLLSLDAQTDERLSASTSLRMMGTRSILCLPIATRTRSFGMIYLDSSVRAGVLTSSDLKLGNVIAGMAASAIERAEDFSRMVQREKLAAIGTLTAGLLHELNNPLAAILGLSELLDMEVGGELTEGLLQEGRRCQRLIQDLLRLSRQEPPELVALNLADVVDAAAAAARSELERYQVRLILDVEACLPLVAGNADHLRQVVLNLMTNAIFEAGRRAGGCVEVRLKVAEAELLLVVADNGPGISPGNLGKLFDPFFSTKNEQQGTGLGLSIIARIVNEHGGKVVAENRSSGGALFKVTLPLLEQAPSRQAV